MCGIVGLIDTIAGSVSPGLLDTLRDEMIRRGPDGEGHYINGAVGMAMRRLAIIDIEGGGQPFLSANRAIVAFQNGEIYNYRDLRRQLSSNGYQFISASDTEVLTHGFVEWGAGGLLQRLDGMYATAILDEANQQLHLARDRFGEKPLFYTHAEGRFAYSSTLLSLAALDWVSDEIDFESLDRYLALHYVPGESTIFKAIKRVLPGERLVIPLTDPYPQRFRYYALRLGDQQKIAEHDLATMVEEAVSSRLVADVPVGVFLSGGVDSSVVAAIAAQKQPHISTFSMGFDSPTHDESRHAESVARAIGSNHYHFLFDQESFNSLLPLVAASLDEPVGDQAQLPLYWLCKEARRHVTVALSGEGADEIFAGYDYYRRHATALSSLDRLKARFGGSQSARRGWARLIHNLEPVTPSGFPLLTDAAGRERLTGSQHTEMTPWEEHLLMLLERSADSLQRAAATDLSTWLPDDLLVKFDRISMAHSLEGRAPYLAPWIVEAGLSLPQSEKMSGETSKVALRRIARRWLSAEILNRPKQGFVLPMGKWLGQWFEGHAPIREYFLSRAVPGLDMNEVARLTSQDLSSGVQRERLLFALLLLVEWYQSFKSRQQALKRKCRESVAAPRVMING